MKKKILSTVSLYTFATAAIFCWWYFAFLFPSPNKTLEKPVETLNKTLRIPPPQYLSYLSSLDRSLIQNALSGDIKIMTTLMADWDVDARILEKHGLLNVKRLPREKFLKAQMIGRKLLNCNSRELQELREKFCSKTIIDDNGLSFDVAVSFQKFLPQTYISASFLLALTEPKNIVAIPQGFRNQKDLYPQLLTDRIPLDINRYNSERIYQSKPDIAFVAHYSHPSTLQALSNQGVPLFTLKSIDTIPEITNAINRIGHIVQRPFEAELLTLFMKSAMLAIDNRLLAMSHAVIEEHDTPRIMFLQHFSQFSLPTEKTITGQLLERFDSQKFTFVSLHKNRRNEWMIPIEQEQIVNINPDCLIVATSNGDLLKEQLKCNPAFSSLSAIKNNNIYFIDATPQAPTQYVILAYYDIAEVIVKATSPYLR